MVPLTVWTTYGLVTTETEGHLPLAYTVTTIAMLLTAYSYGRMVIAQPIAGSRVQLRLAVVRAARSASWSAGRCCSTTSSCR